MQTNIDRTVKFTPPWDDSPIDISFVFESEMPAGKHGFLTCKEGKMVFEDGVEAKFWGTNFNSAACFPSHEYSEMVAKRLAKFGLNMVRFHQMDGDWSTPNIFQFTRGKRLENTRSLDPESMDRLDYLIYALKKNGIYVYMDLLTYRRFRSGDGVENAINLRDAAKKHSMYDEQMILLQKEFCDQLWNHYNPYTKLAYKDDPAIALTEITNESEIFGNCDMVVEPYLSRLKEKYQAWRKENGYPPAENINLSENSCTERTREMTLFKIDLQKKYFDDMREHMRQNGVKIPIAGTNWNSGGVALLHASTGMDFTDSHCYWCDWKWSPHLKQFRNASFLGNRDTWLACFPFYRTADRPFFISEWDDPWPNQYRAEGTLHIAACTALQGWSGTTIHTYRYDNRPNIDMIAAPITGEALSGVPYRSGVFDAFNDPCRFSLFYHAALMVRRKDVRTSGQLTVVPVNELLLSDAKAKGEEYVSRGRLSADCTNIPEGVDGPSIVYNYPALDCACDHTTTATMVDGMTIPANAKVVDPYERVIPKDVEKITSDTGELTRDLKKRIALIDSPRTKAAYGFLGAAGEIKLDGVTIRCRNAYAAVVMSSLTDAPIAESDNILLTVVGNCDNTDAQYNDNHTVQYSKGHGPIEAEVIEAEIEIENNQGIFRVDAIGDNGMQVGSANPVTENGKIKFSTGGDFPSIHYLIQKI